MRRKKLSIDFVNQNLIKVPSEVFLNKNVRKLSLRNNKIKIIPKEISNLTKLEVLDLSFNEIKNIYAKLFELPNLKILILNNNKIKTLPKQIMKLERLKILGLANNEIEVLPKEIEHLKNLEELNLSGNKLSLFPESIYNLLKLKSLWISNNSFKEIPQNNVIDKLKNLKRVYFYGSRISTDNKSNSVQVDFSEIKGNAIDYFRRQNPTLQMTDHSKKEVMKGFKNKIFLSYAHKDEKWLERINEHIKVLNIQGVDIEVWSDKKIKAGQNWRDEINKALEESYIAILLVSTAFLASDFINSNELPPLLENAQKKGAKIIPVIVSACRFLKSKELSIFQSINNPSKPLEAVDYNDQEMVLMSLANEVEEYVKENSDKKN